MTPELLFARYAFPLVVLRGEDPGWEAKLRSEAITRQDLEQRFPEHTRRLAAWTLPAVRQYFFDRYHAADLPVERAHVIEHRPPLLIVRAGETRTVVDMFTPRSAPGDTVAIHGGFAVEVL